MSRTKTFKICLMTLLFYMLGSNLSYGQTDSVLMSIDEIRIVGKVLNENQYLRIENKILDSMIIVNNKHIDLLSNSLYNCKNITDQQLKTISGFEEIDRMRVQQINNMIEVHKKEKRKTALKFGGFGVAAGVILMLIFK